MSSEPVTDNRPLTLHDVTVTCSQCCSKGWIYLQQSLTALSKGANTAVGIYTVKGGEHGSHYLHCQRGRTQQSLSTLSKGANTALSTLSKGRTRQSLLTMSKGANIAVIVYTIKGGEHSSHCLHYQRWRTRQSLSTLSKGATGGWQPYPPAKRQRVQFVNSVALQMTCTC